jgi:phosphoribosylanthranilate isomerase
MRPLVKICGLTTPEDARLCREAGADLLGVIFADSPRQVTTGQAADIRAACSHAPLVGVFTDHRPQAIADVVAAVGLDLVQLHGCDDPAQWEAVARATGVPVMPAVTADRADQAAGAMAARGDLPVSALLLDLPKILDPAALAGGTCPDARLALLEAARRCRRQGLRVMLAGALAAEDLPLVLREARPFGLDVCRGVESSPGVKDPERVARFLAAARRPEVDRVH